MPAPGHQYRDNEQTVNPFEERIPHINEYTAREIATLQSRLDRQLGPEYISTRPGAGGGKVHYLAAEKVINLANEVFGFNGWSSEIKTVQIDFVDESSSGKISLGLSVISRVTLKDGVFHEDIGYGHIENCKGKAAAFEKAKKEAATDAMKRALRNFGNVLGNCLYDKDYLARVTRVKVAPSKWDAENLHRHPDFAPIKKESIADVEAAATVASRAPTPARLTSNVSAQSNGTEFEDDYGGNLFDEVDFNHPDEVRLDDSTTKLLQNGSGPASNRQSVNIVASMSALRTLSNGQPGPQNAQQPPRSNDAPLQRQNNSMHQQNGQSSGQAMPPPDQFPQQAQRGPQQPNGGSSHNAAPQNHDATRSAPSSASSTSQPDKPTEDGDRLTPLGEANQPMPQQITTPQGPVTFVSGKAANILNQANGNAPAAIVPFDPHADSPSIRRTQGVDPRKSAPIRRKEIGVPTMPILHPGPPANKGGLRSGSVTPAVDTARRMAPVAQQSPANRNAYKPPSMLKRAAPTDGNVSRPALTDMSNMQQPTNGEPDPKKTKVDNPPATEVKDKVS